jgi:hypothetical protein
MSFRIMTELRGATQLVRCEVAMSLEEQIPEFLLRVAGVGTSDIDENSKRVRSCTRGLCGSWNAS